MSGLPNNVQVEELRKAAARVLELDDVAEHLRKEIADAQRRLEQAGHERHQKAAEVLELLRKMDVASNHNIGWENRVVAFLSMLVDSAETYGRTHR